MGKPEPLHRQDKPKEVRDRGRALPVAVDERGAQVRLFLRHRLVDRFRVHRIGTGRLDGAFRPIEEVPAMSLACFLQLAARRELIQGELVNGFEHPETGRAVRPEHPGKEALVEQRRDGVHGVPIPVPHHPFGRLQGEAPGKDGEATNIGLRRWREEVVAPGDRRAHGPVACGRVPGSVGQEGQPRSQAGQQRRRWQHPGARRGQLDRQRQAVEPRADLGDDRFGRLVQRKRRIVHPCPLDEEGHRVGSQRQRRHRVLPLAGQAQRGAAGDEHRQVVGIPHQRGDQRGRVEDLFEVVEQQQQAPGLEEGAQPLPHLRVPSLAQPQGRADRRDDQFGTGDVGESDERHPIRKSVARGRDRFQRQAGLADAAGAGQRQEADSGIAQQRAHGDDVLAPTDEGRERLGERGEFGRGDRQGHQTRFAGERSNGPGRRTRHPWPPMVRGVALQLRRGDAERRAAFDGSKFPAGDRSADRPLADPEGRGRFAGGQAIGRVKCVRRTVLHAAVRSMRSVPSVGQQ